MMQIADVLEISSMIQLPIHVYLTNCSVVRGGSCLGDKSHSRCLLACLNYERRQVPNHYYTLLE
jgi:hypothetical protein